MNAKKTTILVIDDEQALLESVQYYLEDRNYRVLTAADGAESLQVFNRTRLDLILTNLRMPRVDGLEVLRQVVAADLPVIVVSGTGNISDSVQALHLGAWDYILKPVTEMAIIGYAVEHALERVRLLRENHEYQRHIEQQVVERTAELRLANEELASINHRLRKIVETTRVFHISSDMLYLGSTVLNGFARLMAAQGGSIFIIEDKGLRRLHSIDGHHAPEFISFPLPEQSLLRKAIETGKPVLIQNIRQAEAVVSSG